ncbi:MAG: GNAT family N-acetyltransferase [Thermoanaerobaculia bacterium]
MAPLAAELGYAVSDAALASRLTALAGSEDDIVLIEEDEAGELLGFIHGQRRRGLLGDERAEIVALVVAAGARRRGSGRRLVDAVAGWAAEGGLGEIRVRTNVRRDDAAAFYAALGFAESKRQRVFERPARGATAPDPDER